MKNLCYATNNNALWHFVRIEAAKKQTQTKPILYTKSTGKQLDMAGNVSIVKGREYFSDFL